MNKIAKILSAVISVTVALTIAVVMLTSALAATKTTFAMNLVEETDSTVVIEVKLESGSFAALDFGIEYNDAKIKGCTTIDYILEKNFVVTAFEATCLFSGAKADGFDKAGSVLATYTFEKVAGAKVSAEDFAMVITNCTVVDGSAVDYEIENNIPVVEKPTEPSTEATEPSTEATEPSTEATEPSTEATEPSTEATEPSTEATEPSTEATEPSTEATEPSIEATEPSTEATEPSTEATEPSTEATEPSTEATEPSTEATEPSTEATEPSEEPTEAPTEAPTEKPADGDVVNPDTGDSVTATAAIFSLLAVSGAAIVALRKKED